jgi:diphosphomevalonate decarboxylase
MEIKKTVFVNGIDQESIIKGDGNDGNKGSCSGGSTSWRSPSNIALVKYWGKKKGQIPENPSISITLSRSFTETILEYFPSGKNKGILKRFSFEERDAGPFEARIKSFLKDAGSLYPFMDDFDLSIKSSNSFPHSSGIASSASAMSSLALCLTSLERRLINSPTDDDSFFRKASYAARLGSGSAARSVYPGFVLWGKVPEIPFSANEFAVPVNDLIHDNFKDLRDAVLLVDDSPKSVSSSTGHVLMQSNPWAGVRYREARSNTTRLLEALSCGDLDEFVIIVETEALTLHAMMMCSEKGYLLLRPGTLEIIEKVREFRRSADVPVAFSLDAGPNIHLIYPGSYYSQVKEFIEGQLLGHCKNGEWIDDFAGSGPLELQTEK